MIHDASDRLACYDAILPRAAELAGVLRSPAFDPDDPLTHGGFRILRKAYENRADSARQFETHDRTVDLMIGLGGGERIHLCAEGELEPGAPLPNGADGRKLVGAPRGSAVLLKEGTFLAILPREAHMVAGRTEGFEGIDKLVVKLPLQAERPDCPCTSQCVRHGICSQCVVWHRNPKNSLPSCLREKGKALIARAVEAEKAARDK